jgi:hypothetical protein
LSKEIREHAKKFNQKDEAYANFLGNLSELIYNNNKGEEACTLIKEGRMITWY